jgi:hypothetical protein
MNKALCMTFLMALSAAVFADTPLTGDQIKLLISGNSVDIHSNVNGRDFKFYFAADGSITARAENGSTFKGAWRITDSGEQCTKLDGKDESCGQLLDTGDGSYKRMEGGSPRAIWKKIYPGNRFGL